MSEPTWPTEGEWKLEGVMVTGHTYLIGPDGLRDITDDLTEEQRLARTLGGYSRRKTQFSEENP